MSKEFGSEIQIPIEQQTIMDSNVSSSLENQDQEKGVGVAVIDKEIVKEDEVISRVTTNSEENQEIPKGLMEDSAKEVCCQVQDSRFVNNTHEMNSETSFECHESSSDEKKEGGFQVQDVIADDDRIIFVVDRSDFVVPDSFLPSQNYVAKSNWNEVDDDETYWGEGGESSSGSKQVVAEIGAQIGNEMGSIGLGEKSAGVCSENIRQEVVIQKKSSRRKFTETNLKKNVLSMFAEAKNVCEKKSDGSKRRYSRIEMEVLRSENPYQQRQIWREIYTGLGPIVAKELSFLAEDKKKGNAITDQQQHHRQHPRQQKQHHQCPQQSQQHHQKHPQKPHQHRRHQQAGVNIENTSILGETDCSQNLELNMEEHSLGEEYPQFIDNTFTLCDDHANGSSYYENEESEDEYDSIKKPAFYVEGDPDFDSGPAEDGLEYLRRVRWEAAQIPNVTIAKLDKTMMNKEQTPYMPQLPDIAKCPLHLQPSKEWEDAFLADFSELRQAVSHLEGSKAFQPMSVADVDKASRCSCDPTVSVILGMDYVARVSMLKRCINSFETKSSLCRNDCAWLFALFVAVDIPLDGDSIASVRCLLRKCASLRAAKLEASEDDDDDDEVVKLNMLVTICRRFFGQLD